jgi:hypothetical protein
LSATAVLASIRWAQPGGADAAEAIFAFLETIGIGWEMAPVDPPGRLPGLAIVAGSLRIDPAVAVWPGDLLHEAGHIAVADPARRGMLGDPGDDPADEMAAQAWSAAAAQACGIALRVVFHDGGYWGDGSGLAEAFARGQGPGVPMLAWYGMTAEPRRASEDGIAGFPVMQRWLR